MPQRSLSILEKICIPFSNFGFSRFFEFWPMGETTVHYLGFNRRGDLLCTDESRSNVVLDWEKNQKLVEFTVCEFLELVTKNKFIDSTDCLEIVSLTNKGRVFCTNISFSGSTTQSEFLFTDPRRPVHDFVVVPNSRHEIFTVTEGSVQFFDLRIGTSATNMIPCVNKSYDNIIAHHPFLPEFCSTENDDKLNVYDERILSKPVHEITVPNVKKLSKVLIDSVVYNPSDSEILVAGKAGIFLFDSCRQSKGGYLHFYDINSCAANFFGPRSEYIVGSDERGNYFWDKNTTELISVNRWTNERYPICLEPHPWRPVLASANLEDCGILIWSPNGYTY